MLGVDSTLRTHLTDSTSSARNACLDGAWAPIMVFGICSPRREPEPIEVQVNKSQLGAKSRPKFTYSEYVMPRSSNAVGVVLLPQNEHTLT